MAALDSLNLPEDIAQGLSGFIESAQAALGDTLVAVVLFGSAAEGRLRSTSDVNLMLVLSRFDTERLARLRAATNLAHAAIRLSTMWILESELVAASEAFAVKFADIIERHRLLFGRDVIGGLAPSREAKRTRLQQILLNFVLRNREHYALIDQREEQCASLIAEAAAPLRAAAALILDLQGRRADSPKAALELLADEESSAWREVLANLSLARETRRVPPGTGESTLLRLIELARHLRTVADGLS